MWRYIKPYLLYGILAVLLMTGEVTCDLLQPRLMTGIVDRYNSAQAESAAPAAELSFGPTSNGVGLSLRF